MKLMSTWHGQLGIRNKNLLFDLQQNSQGSGSDFEDCKINTFCYAVLEVPIFYDFDKKK